MQTLQRQLYPAVSNLAELPCQVKKRKRNLPGWTVELGDATDNFPRYFFLNCLLLFFLSDNVLYLLVYPESSFIPPPPLDLTSWPLLIFLHPGIENVERNLV